MLRRKEKKAFLHCERHAFTASCPQLTMAPSRALNMNLVDSSAKVVGLHSNHIGIDVVTEAIGIAVLYDTRPGDAYPPLTLGFALRSFLPCYTDGID